MRPKLWKALASSLVASVAAIGVFLLLMSAPFLGSGQAAETGAQTALRVSTIGYLLALPLVWPLVFLSGTALLLVLRQQRIAVTVFAIGGLLEGAIVVSLLWDWFWGFPGVDLRLLAVGGMAGASGGAVFASMFRRMSRDEAVPSH